MKLKLKTRIIKSPPPKKWLIKLKDSSALSNTFEISNRPCIFLYQYFVFFSARNLNRFLLFTSILLFNIHVPFCFFAIDNFDFWSIAIYIYLWCNYHRVSFIDTSSSDTLTKSNEIPLHFPFIISQKLLHPDYKTEQNWNMYPFYFLWLKHLPIFLTEFLFLSYPFAGKVYQGLFSN